MSHLDNRGNKIIIILLIIFTIVCSGITAGLIYFENSNTKGTNEEVGVNTTEKKVKNEKIKPDGLGVKSLNDKYKINNLEFETIDCTTGEIMPDGWSSNPTYIKIKGLKDQKIENAINEEIKSIVSEMASTDYGYDNNQIYTSVSANFSNVLSIAISRNSYDNYVENVETRSEYKTINLNYNLVTGEKLKFKDIFTNDANMKNIISQSAYKSLAWNYPSSFEDGPLGIDMDLIENPNTEEQVAALIYEFENQEEFDFSFTPSYAYLNIGDKKIQIELAYFYNQVAIFNRFSTNKSIFENENLKECLVFFDRGGGYSRGINDFLLEEVTDRLFVNAVFLAENKEIIKIINSEIQYKIKDCQEYLRNNPEQAIILGICADQYEDGADVYVCFLEYKMSKDFYEEKAIYKMIYYHEAGEISSIIRIWDEAIEIMETFENRSYNLQNNTYDIKEYKYELDQFGRYSSVLKNIKTYNATTGELIKSEDINSNNTTTEELIKPEDINSNNTIIEELIPSANIISNKVIEEENKINRMFNEM